MIKGLIVGLQFLTRLPVNISVDFNEENIKKSLFFYPFIGMLLGLISYLPYYLFKDLSLEIASFLSILSMIILTGGLHLDGLADMFDGFFSNREKEEVMEIMHDSRIGAFGVLGMILVIMSKYIFLSNMEENILAVLVFSMGNARFISLIFIAYKKMARPGGLGDMLHSSNAGNYVISSIVLYIVIMAIVDYRYIITLIISLIIAQIISKISYKKIGGLTGDIYGATVEIIESVSFFSFLVVTYWIL